MTQNLGFWIFSILLLSFATICALAGVLRIRRGDLLAHRRRMLVAMASVATFLLSYLLKLALVGREDLDLWDPNAVWTLRVHESFMAIMLVTGAVAFALARRFHQHPAGAERGSARRRFWHSWFGRVAVVAAVCGLLLACRLLFLMVSV